MKTTAEEKRKVYVQKYCPYCKRQTKHLSQHAGEPHTPGSMDVRLYLCEKCGSANATIQGFAADLM